MCLFMRLIILKHLRLGTVKNMGGKREVEV